MTLAVARSWSRSAGALACSFALLATLASCVATDMTGTGGGSNIPVVGMSDGQFGFAIAARDWTSDQSYAADLAGNTLQIGLVVAVYSGGTGAVTITDASGSSVFSQNLAGNIAEGGSATVHGTAPFHVRVTTSRYSGTISLGISPAAPPSTSLRR